MHIEHMKQNSIRNANANEIIGLFMVFFCAFASKSGFTKHKQKKKQNEKEKPNQQYQFRYTPISRYTLRKVHFHQIEWNGFVMC